MKVAFCTNSNDKVDEHFGRAKQISVYEITDESAAFDEVRSFVPIDATQDHKVDIETKVGAIKDCAILYLCEIGGPAAAIVVKNRIHPVKVDEGTPIDDVVSQLQHTLATNPPPWLKKILMEKGA